MTRTVLALSSGILCALMGLRCAASLRHEASRLSAWTDALRRLPLLLAEGTFPLPEALRLAGEDLPGPDGLLSGVADAMASDPLLSLPEIMSQQCPVCTERALLLRLATRLSCGSLESRCHACGQAADSMAQLASEAAAHAARDARLWQTLGVTGGACLTLLLI